MKILALGARERCEKYLPRMPFIRRQEPVADGHRPDQIVNGLE